MGHHEHDFIVVANGGLNLDVAKRRARPVLLPKSLGLGAEGSSGKSQLLENIGVWLTRGH